MALMAARARNPRRVVLEALREQQRQLRVLVRYWDQSGTTYDEGTDAWRPLTEAEKRENDRAAWANLRDHAALLESKAVQLRVYAEAQVRAIRTREYAAEQAEAEAQNKQ